MILFKDKASGLDNLHSHIYDTFTNNKGGYSFNALFIHTIYTVKLDGVDVKTLDPHWLRFDTYADRAVINGPTQQSYDVK